MRNVIVFGPKILYSNVNDFISSHFRKYMNFLTLSYLLTYEGREWNN